MSNTTSVFAVERIPDRSFRTMAIGNIFLMLFCSPLYAMGIIAARRLFFHPLRAIPGPSLAAITRLYSFYYNVILPWKYGDKVDRLHRRHGKFGYSSSQKMVQQIYLSQVP